MVKKGLASILVASSLLMQPAIAQEVDYSVPQTCEDFRFPQNIENFNDNKGTYIHLKTEKEDYSKIIDCVSDFSEENDLDLDVGKLDNLSGDIYGVSLGKSIMAIALSNLQGKVGVVNPANFDSINYVIDPQKDFNLQVLSYRY